MEQVAALVSQAAQDSGLFEALAWDPQALQSTLALTDAHVAALNSATALAVQATTNEGTLLPPEGSGTADTGTFTVVPGGGEPTFNGSGSPPPFQGPRLAPSLPPTLTQPPSRVPVSPPGPGRAPVQTFPANPPLAVPANPPFAFPARPPGPPPTLRPGPASVPQFWPGPGTPTRPPVQPPATPAPNGSGSAGMVAMTSNCGCSCTAIAALAAVVSNTALTAITGITAIARGDS